MKMGIVKVKLTSADVTAALDRISKSGMVLRNLRVKDGLAAEFRVEKSDLRELNRMVQQHGEQIEIISHEGIYWGIRHLVRRPVMLSGIVFLLFLTMWLPTRILFLQVEGNTTVPTRLILEAAGECGIGFGAKAREVRSEKMKNALLHQIPNLQWAGINTDGCVAVISVREKTAQDQEEYRYPISSMVASRDGYITEITVTAGAPACKVGQSVEKGQVLISGYTDCGTHLLATKAEGEVYANTKEHVTAVTPQMVIKKSKEIRTEQHFGILFGKKLIKFENWSGIWGQECDRIKSVSYMTLPGGFQLPVAIVTETVVFCETVFSEVTPAEAEQMLTDRASHYLLENMVAGKIEQADTKCLKQQGNFVLTGSYDCNEMICKIRTEEILQDNEQRN